MMNGMEDRAQRRTQIVAGIMAETGIDEPMIRSLVVRFYDKARADDLLGPVFNARIRDWSPHLDRMCEFWSSVALMSGTYHGSPMARHFPLPVSGAHFDRWLRLFEQAADEVCPPKAAEHFISRARRIAESIEMGIAGHRGVLLGKGERLETSTCFEPTGTVETRKATLG